MNIFLGVSFVRDYTIQISNNVFIPEDLTKNCALYPNTAFDSYRECDEKSMRNSISSMDPPDLIPVWLAETFENVTKKKTMNRLGKHIVRSDTALRPLTVCSQLPPLVWPSVTWLSVPSSLTVPCLVQQLARKPSIFLTDLIAEISPDLLSPSRARCW